MDGIVASVPQARLILFLSTSVYPSGHALAIAKYYVQQSHVTVIFGQQFPLANVHAKYNSFHSIYYSIVGFSKRHSLSR